MRVTKSHNRGWIHKRAILLSAFGLMALSIFFSFYFFTSPSIQAERNSLQHYIQQQQKDFQTLLNDTAIMRRLVQQKLTVDQFEKLDQKPYGIFLFAETINNTPEFLFWNDHKILPPDPDFGLEDGEYFKELENGYYVYEKRTVHLENISSNVIVYSMIPVLSQYEVKTSYLTDQFAHSDEAHKKIAISDTGFPIKSINNQDLFYITKKQDTAPINSTLVVVLQLASLILIFSFLHFTADEIAYKKGTLAGVGFLALALFISRALMYIFPDLFFFHQTPLFYVNIFGANNLLRTLGDLLINALFFCWLTVFAWRHISKVKQLPPYLVGNKLLISGIVAISVLIWSTFLLAHVVSTLVAHSDISFYVNDFFTLDYNTVVGFVVLAMISLGYYYLTRILFKIIFPAFEKPVYVYFIVALAGLLYLTFVPSIDSFTFQLSVLLWLVVYTILGREHIVLNRFRANIAGVLFWIIIFSASLAGIILKENLEKEWEQRKEFARNLVLDSSPSVFNILNIGIQYIDNRFLVNNLNRFADPLEHKFLRDSILKFSLSPGFAEDYKVQLYLFDSSNKGIYNEDSVSFFELNEIYTTRSNPTINPNIYRHEKRQSEFTYLTKRTIRDSSGLLGNLFIVSTPKRFKGEGFSFELLGQINEKTVNLTQKYDFAIYSGEKLDSSSSYVFPFPTVLMQEQIPGKGYSERSMAHFHQLWYNAGPVFIGTDAKNGPDKIVVVIKKQDVIIEGITLFSYLFCSFLLMIGVLNIISVILKSGNSWRALQSFWQLNIRSQIQGIIIFISVLSFIIIGIVTISFFIERYNRNNQEELTRISGVLVREIESNLPIVAEADSTLAEFDIDSATLHMQNLVDRLASMNGVDINIYDLWGDIVFTSAPDVFDKNVLSTKMHPKAYYHLNRQQQEQYLQDENMSSLRFQSIYRAVRDTSGETQMYFNIPFYTSEFELEEEISNFLVAIINLNAFVFLIAGTIAVVITNRITRSFSVIGSKMKAITLGSTNEEIEWKRNDEIGELIKQYNKMVRQLEQSAEALAKSEREGAWREMARQVAHEIKNPLTPMKLSIQYLQKAITNGQTNVKDLTTNVANTLIEQIDHLSKIAADFGRFANIGNPQLEVFDLHTVLASLKDLYSSNPKLQLRWNKIESELIVEADRTHMNRLFTNLLANAIDACSNQDYCQVETREERRGNNILVLVRDNGEGISPEMQPKIFTPNFTTKSSGTGLGLAICKSIVEQARGDIWFETAIDSGTTFYVLLPLADTF